MVVGILGLLPFVSGEGTIFTPNDIGKTRKENYVRHKIIADVDLIESTGSEPIEITLQMQFFAPWTLAPAASILALETLQSTKLPVPLICGDAPVGRGLLTLFVVESVSSKMKRWTGTTTAVATADVKLLEYSNPFSLAGPLNALGAVGASVLGAGL
jgi:hypothetical protein